MNKGRLVGIIMSVIISLAMGVVSSALVIYTNPETLKVNSAGSIYAFNIILSLLLGVIIALFVPLGKLGEALAQLPPFPVMWLGSWIRLLLPTLLISYLLSVLLAPLVTGLVGLNRPAPGRPQ